MIVSPIDGKDIYDGKNNGDVCFSKEYVETILEIKIEGK
jgi:hypothetical protein